MTVNAKIWRPFRDTENTLFKILRTRCPYFLQVFHWVKLKIKKKTFPKMIFHFLVGFHNASNFSCRLLLEIGLSPLLKINLPWRLCWQPSMPFSYSSCEILIQKESPLIAGIDNLLYWMSQALVTSCAKVWLLLPAG